MGSLLLFRREFDQYVTLRPAHDAIVGTIEKVTAEGPRTPDMGGTASTADVGKAVADAVSEMS